MCTIEGVSKAFLCQVFSLIIPCNNAQDFLFGEHGIYNPDKIICLAPKVVLIPPFPHASMQYHYIQSFFPMTNDRPLRSTRIIFGKLAELKLIAGEEIKSFFEGT